MGLKDFRLKMDSGLMAEICESAKLRDMTPASFAELCIRNTLYEKHHADFDKEKLYTARRASISRGRFEIT